MWSCGSGGNAGGSEVEGWSFQDVVDLLGWSLFVVDWVKLGWLLVVVDWVTLGCSLVVAGWLCGNVGVDLEERSCLVSVRSVICFSAVYVTVRGPAVSKYSSTSTASIAFMSFRLLKNCLRTELVMVSSTASVGVLKSVVHCMC